jgi:CheY-like chemotaxis protein
VLTVRDTGEGIREDLLPYVFERFRQGDNPSTRRHEGAGIGLSLVHELVELHGGNVSVESEVGFGSAFTVRLPLGKGHLDAELLAGDGADDLAPPVAGGSTEDAVVPMPGLVLEASEDEGDAPAVRTDATVLVVEDHDDMRAYLRGLLAPHYHVEEASDGEDGLESARRLAAEGRTPDLVISDVMMPGLDGYALCHALKADEALGHVPVVLLTARADQESKLEGLSEGADDYLAKPFSAEELLARCENLIEVRRRLRARFSGEVVVRPTGVVVEQDEADWVDEVKAVCEERLSDPNFGVDWLADELDLSARTLRRRMKAVSGLTPGAFLRTLRLERAAELLEQRAGGVAEVAAAVGYAEAESFSRAFRQGFGVPPSTYAERGG